MTNWKPVTEAHGATVAKRRVWPNGMEVGKTYHVSRYYSGDFIGELTVNGLEWVEMKVVAVFTGPLHPGETVRCDGRLAAFHVAKQVAA
jgi:hypothetical protein